MLVNILLQLTQQVGAVGQHRSPPLPISMGWKRLWRLPLTALLRAKSRVPVVVVVVVPEAFDSFLLL